MRTWFDRWFVVGSFVIAAALTIASVLARLPLPSRLVPAAYGLAFMVLLFGVHWQYQSRRRDSPAYQQHLGNLRDYARAAKESALFTTDNHGNMFRATRPIDTTLPRAKDFLAHYPKVGAVMTEWNQMALGWTQLLGRYGGFSHKSSEEITGSTNSSLARLLISYGGRDVDLDDVAWRVNNGHIEASWELDVDNEPAWVPIMQSPGTVMDAYAGRTEAILGAKLEEVKAKVADFPAQPLTVERRRQQEINDRLRPILIAAFDDAEMAVELTGHCPHCPK